MSFLTKLLDVITSLCNFAREMLATSDERAMMDKIRVVSGSYVSYNRGLFALKIWTIYTGMDKLYDSIYLI